MAVPNFRSQFKMRYETQASVRNLLRLADQAHDTGDWMLAEELIESVYRHFSGRQPPLQTSAPKKVDAYTETTLSGAARNVNKKPLPLLEEFPCALEDEFW